MTISTERLREILSACSDVQKVRYRVGVGVSAPGYVSLLPEEVEALVEAYRLRSPSRPDPVLLQYRYIGTLDPQWGDKDHSMASRTDVTEEVRPLFAAPVPSPAIAEALDDANDRLELQGRALQSISAARSEGRKQAFEEAAKIADEWLKANGPIGPAHNSGMHMAAEFIAADIRRTAQGGE
jgi:hypothetical protein